MNELQHALQSLEILMEDLYVSGIPKAHAIRKNILIKREALSTIRNALKVEVDYDLLICAKRVIEANKNPKLEFGSSKAQDELDFAFDALEKAVEL